MMVLMLWLCALSTVLRMMVRLLLLPALSIPRIKRWRVLLMVTNLTAFYVLPLLLRFVGGAGYVIDRGGGPTLLHE